MSLVNQKHGLPRLGSGKGFVPRRGKFLDGALRSLFAPAQRPDSGESYKPPTDWPKAGSLLRVPQVVWLTGQVDHRDFYQFGLVAEQVRIDYGLAGGFLTYPNSHFVTNLNLRDYRAWQEVFAEAKARIESVRPGRTWVHVADWLSWSSGTDSSEGPFLEFGGVGTASEFHYRYLYEKPNYLHLRCPPSSDAGDFFGTDFLHFHVGHWCRDSFLSRAFATPDSTPVLETTSYLNDKANITANAKRFRRFAVHCYGYTQEWEQYPLAVDGDSYANPLGIGTFNDFIRFQNAGNTNSSLDSNTLIESTCEDLESSGIEGSDVRYAGLFDGLGVDDVVSAIADHFGFDPDTGKDVG